MKALTARYDIASDVVYISMGPPRSATTVTGWQGERFIFRVDGQGNPAGLTIIDYSTMTNPFDNMLKVAASFFGMTQTEVFDDLRQEALGKETRR